MKPLALLALAAFLSLTSPPAPAQETRAAGPAAGPPRETYLPPMGGQMAGHFTQSRGDGIWFYEIVTIVERGNSLAYRLRHFNADLTGWEERNQVRDFPLVAREGDAFYFDGLTIRRDGADGMIGAVRIDNADGTSREVVFRYRRAPARRPRD